ncbi:hypothetical protein [Comamonas thiooxydans]|uniref:hypothetical protein n=1 Tax=Comamonas thiooxydans TaxID=363952 RepID=UPI00103ECDD3|nr:hypothetical protein [Comamonas thiooxydans]
MPNTQTSTLTTSSDVTTVHAVAVESTSSGMVDWFHDLASANQHFDAQVALFADIPGERIVLFALNVPAGTSNDKITDLVDEAMHEEAYRPIRVHVTAVQLFYPTPQGVLEKLISVAEDHIREVESGLDDGTYDRAENVNLPQAKAAVQVAKESICFEGPRLEGVDFNRKMVLQARATASNGEPPEYCEFPLSKDLLAKIIRLSKACEDLNVSDMRFEFHPVCWGKEGTEERADLSAPCIVVGSQGEFWITAIAEAYNCHFETDVYLIDSVISWVKGDDSATLFETDEVKEAFTDNQEDASFDMEDESSVE